MSSRGGPRGSGRHLFAVPDVAGGEAAATPEGISALAQLAELAARSATGELVCSCTDGEIHVFLQGGRIAWASSTRQRRAFTEHLKRIAGVDDEVIETVVTECARTRRPIGEGLIAWKVATAEQVRAALLHQIRMALESAVEAADARTLFLERAQYRYDTVLTFALGEVLPNAPSGDGDDPGDRPSGVRRAQGERTAQSGEPPAAVAGAGSPLGPAAELATMEGVAAAAVLSARGELLALTGTGARVGEVAGLTHQLLQEGQRLAIDLGAGLCREVHVEAEGAHVLVYSTRRSSLAPLASGPGAWLRIVLVLRDLGCLPVARQRVHTMAAELAAGPTS